MNRAPETSKKEFYTEVKKRSGPTTRGLRLEKKSEERGILLLNKNQKNPKNFFCKAGGTRLLRGL